MENVNKLHKASLTPLEKFALLITKRIGSMQFFFIIVVWTVGWMFWNMFAPAAYKFDEVPAFVMWLFISNMLQIFLMPLIMIGQNVQSKHAELRAEHHYQADIKADKYVTDITKILMEQTELLREIQTLLKEKK
jgi:uncharacterized membrane protein